MQKWTNISATRKDKAAETRLGPMVFSASYDEFCARDLLTLVTLTFDLLTLK